MKFKFPFLILGSLVLFLFFLYFFYKECITDVSIKNGISFFLDKDKNLDTFLIFIFSFLMLICSLNIELIYDKENGILCRKFFFKKKQVNCSEIASLCYIPLQGNLLIIGRTGETLFFWSHIYNKSNFRKLFNEIKKDYPNVEIDI